MTTAREQMLFLSTLAPGVAARTHFLSITGGVSTIYGEIEVVLMADMEVTLEADYTVTLEPEYTVTLEADIEVEVC